MKYPVFGVCLFLAVVGWIRAISYLGNDDRFIANSGLAFIMLGISGIALKLEQIHETIKARAAQPASRVEDIALK